LIPFFSRHSRTAVNLCAPAPVALPEGAVAAATELDVLDEPPQEASTRLRRTRAAGKA
jgi:hypothetical protein